MALMKRGTDIYARDNDQRTPLHWACDNGLTEVTMALMERGADIDARDNELRHILKLLNSSQSLICNRYKKWIISL